MIFVTSWDDGHPCDLRIAELLDRYDLKGTFYIPICNAEGKQVMPRESIRLIDTGFEVGSHTYDHIYLNKLSFEDCFRQILRGKTVLEDFVGHSVNGFCYPGGKYNTVVQKAVKDAGITHARTVRNYYVNFQKDKFQIPTTLQFYPHSRFTYWKNYIKQKDFLSRFEVFENVAFGQNWLKGLCYILENQINTDNVIHIWGHSWEIEKHNLWRDLECFFEIVASFQPKTKTVSELVDNHA